MYLFHIFQNTEIGKSKHLILYRIIMYSSILYLTHNVTEKSCNIHNMVLHKKIWKPVVLVRVQSGDRNYTVIGINKTYNENY